MDHSTLVVGVDLGGTSLLAALVDGEGNVLAKSKRKTRAELAASAVVKRVAEAVLVVLKQAGRKRRDVLGVGVGVPGPVNPQDGVVVRCANLGPTWDRFPLATALSDALEGLAVTVDNDVNVGAVGEHTYGAGRGVEDMLAIFVGTGIGGGLILGDRLYSGVRNSAGEVGHMVLDADGPLCGCGQPGHAEALASRTAVERMIREAITSGRSTLVTSMVGDVGEQISSGVIGDAYDRGDEVTVEAVRTAQRYLGLLIASCVNLLDPEVVVVGGGVVERMGESFLAAARVVAQQHFLNQSELDRVRILPAALGDFSGVLGAAVLARQRLV
ncbi:MAG: ROK family protein [Anaerolineae bacterium]